MNSYSFHFLYLTRAPFCVYKRRLRFLSCVLHDSYLYQYRPYDCTSLKIMTARHFVPRNTKLEIRGLKPCRLMIHVVILEFETCATHFAEQVRVDLGYNNFNKFFESRLDIICSTVQNDLQKTSPSFYNLRQKQTVFEKSQSKC